MKRGARFLKTMSLRKNRLNELRNKRQQNKSKKTRRKSGLILSSPDNPLVIIIITLMFFGSMAIFSAGAPEGIELYNNPAYYLTKHLIFLCLGIFALFFTTNFDYRRWKDIALPFSIITICLVGATYVPGLGRTSYGSSRWLIGLPIQPSELAKICSIMLLAAGISDAKSLLSQKMLTCLGLIGVMAVLILLQPNLSIFLIISFVTITMLILGGMRTQLLIPLFVVGPIFVWHHILSNKYQLERITGWLNPWADARDTGYNLIQSWYAIGSGGIWGVGFGNSKQKLFWLPFRHTDFIFSVISEEFGLVGCVILIGIFLAFAQRGFLIASRCSDTFGTLLAAGITYSIVLQAFINIGVATGVLPVTGVTLPLISYGGTSVVVTMFMLGILLNISRKRIKRIKSEDDNDNEEEE